MYATAQIQKNKIKNKLEKWSLYETGHILKIGLDI